jgi:hypothetical protein
MASALVSLPSGEIEPATSPPSKLQKLSELESLLTDASIELEDTFGPLSPPPSVRRLEILLKDAASQLGDSVHAELADIAEEGAGPGETEAATRLQRVHRGRASRVGAQQMAVSAMRQIGKLLIEKVERLRRALGLSACFLM